MLGLFIGGAPIRIPTRFGLGGAHEVAEPAGVNGGAPAGLGGRAWTIGVDQVVEVVGDDLVDGER